MFYTSFEGSSKDSQPSPWPFLRASFYNCKACRSSSVVHSKSLFHGDKGVSNESTVPEDESSNGYETTGESLLT